MVKFNPMITAYLVLYIEEGMAAQNFTKWVSLFTKLENIRYTIGTSALPDIYALALGSAFSCVAQNK